MVEGHERGTCVAAVGGIGGSGTRLAAELLRQLGYFLGDDLNGSLDNLWYTLFFKRMSALDESMDDFAELAEIFRRRMFGTVKFSEEERDVVRSLAIEGRMGHDRAWLRERVESFLSGRTAREPGQPVGWKEPNSFILAERFLTFDSEVRYVHMLRHPLVMAFSKNRNQLENWGPVFFDEPIRQGPRAALSYWCSAHRLVMATKKKWPDRVLIVDYDELCTNFSVEVPRIASFLSMKAGNGVIANFRKVIFEKRRTADDIGECMSIFDERDLSYIESVGYGAVTAG